MERIAGLVIRFEVAVILILQVFLVIVTLIAVASLWHILWLSLPRLDEIGGSVPMLQLALQRAFSGVLLALLGLELLATMTVFAETHTVRLQVILAVALIAIGRHIMVLDFEHVSGAQVLGIAALTLALVGGYYLLGLKPPAGGAGSGHEG
jgi:uncharacterized membrane protein (DUF373 family)